MSFIVGERRPLAGAESRPVHELFAEQARRTPHARAIVHGEQSITYSAFDQRANQVAHYLRGLGAGPNIPIAICLPRSIEMLTAVYGVLKAGGAYVPMDPAYPADRLALMMSESKAHLVLSRQDLLQKFSSAGSAPLIDLTRDALLIGQQPTSSPEPLATPDDLIYLIFTSGSTGKPKAAAVYHRGFTNLIQWFTGDYQVTEADRTLLISALSFDLTQKNLYASLIRGGELHLPEGDLYDPGSLRANIERAGITLLNCTPSVFYPLVEGHGPDGARALQTLRCVFLGGEPIYASRMFDWTRSSFFRGLISNTYGPTECSDIVAFHTLSELELQGDGVIPIGKAVWNTTLVIADENLQPVADGEAGELCVLGAGVGKGYINDAAMTAQKFVSNPFPDAKGDRLYRTGDLVRLRDDGAIDFLGRLDHQVKIRGFRIELGEIEDALRKQEAVKDCVVVARALAEGDGAEKSLIAYVVNHESHAWNAHGLREALHAVLPGHMVPAHYVHMDRFPLTPSGKVDRNALPNPVITVSTPESRPAGETEEKLVTLWREILGLSDIPVDANFFDLGGTSILIARLHARIRQELDAKLPLTALFEAPSVRQLAKKMTARGVDPRIAAIQDRARKQREMWGRRR